MFSGVPNGVDATVPTSWLPWLIGLPLMAVITSPSFMPALSLGPPAITLATNTPSLAPATFRLASAWSLSLGVKLRAGGRASVPAVSGLAIAGDRCNGATGVHHADRGIIGVRDVEIAGGIQCKAFRVVEFRLCGWSSIARITGIATTVAGHCRD